DPGAHGRAGPRRRGPPAGRTAAGDAAAARGDRPRGRLRRAAGPCLRQPGAPARRARRRRRGRPARRRPPRPARGVGQRRPHRRAGGGRPG
ncbi:MAG: NAD(P)HX epimerase / NAD(P)HX dehydratase, partial [uncultured Frankineae bacterium]